MKPLPKWLFPVVIAAFFVSVAGFELFYRVIVRDSAELRDVKVWVTDNDVVQRLVGHVSNIEPERQRTSYYFGTAGSRGRFNLRVTGSKGEQTILVTWHRDKNGAQTIVDQVQDLTGGVLWTRTARQK